MKPERIKYPKMEPTMRLTLEHCIMIERDSRIVFQKGLLQVSNKLGCVVRMVVDSVLYLMRKAGQMTIGKTYPG